jgi:hypothetical protein
MLGQAPRPRTVGAPASAPAPPASASPSPQNARRNPSARAPRAARRTPEPAGSGWDAAPVAPGATTSAARSAGNAWGECAPVEAFSIADMLVESKLLAEAQACNAALVAKLEAVQESVRLKERLLVAAGARARAAVPAAGATRAKPQPRMRSPRTPLGRACAAPFPARAVFWLSRARERAPSGAGAAAQGARAP